MEQIIKKPEFCAEVHTAEQYAVFCNLLTTYDLIVFKLRTHYSRRRQLQRVKTHRGRFKDRSMESTKETLNKLPETEATT